MVVFALRGSENRRPIWNLLVCVLWLFMYCPSIVVATLRPKNLVKRLLTGFPVAVQTERVPHHHHLETNEDTVMNENENGIGGGAINEKKRQYVETSTGEEEEPPADDGKDEETTTSAAAAYAPTKHQSHLYHALEGLDRYPNYLGRWQEQDIDKLEASLEEKLALVRKQRQDLLGRKHAANQLVEALLTTHPEKERWQKLFEPCETWQQVKEKILHPKAIQAIFQSKMFKQRNRAIPSVEAVCKGHVQVQLDPERLEAWLDEELYDVYSFRLLNDEFCQDLCDFSKAFAQVSDERPDLQQQHHKLGSRPFNFDQVGLGWINDLVFHLIMRPLARELFLQSEQLGNDLDWRHGYIAGYSAKPASGKPRERLVTHTDDSEVTMNICLGEKFEGGLLEFRCLRGTPEEGQLLGTFQPQLGLGLIHAGRHFHDVTQVTSGDRFNYIIWARSWGGIRSTKCPCCWLNRRESTDCICGPRWN